MFDYIHLTSKFVKYIITSIYYFLLTFTFNVVDCIILKEDLKITIN